MSNANDYAADFMKYYNRLVSFSIKYIERTNSNAAATIEELRNQLNIYCMNCSWGRRHVTEVAGPKLFENRDIIKNCDEEGFLNMPINKKYAHECPDELLFVFELETAIKNGFRIAGTDGRKTAFEITGKMLDAYLGYLAET